MTHSVTQSYTKSSFTLITNKCSSEMAKAGGISNLLSYSNLVHAVSGAAGSVFAISVFFPLDTVRTRLQVDDNRDAKNTLQMCKDILREEGLEGLYRGWYPVVTALCCSNFVYFYTFNGLKSVFKGNSKKSTPLLDLSLGFFSGIRIISCKLYFKSGLFQGWRSLQITLFVSSFIYFYTYNTLKYMSNFAMGDESTPWILITDLCCACLAGIVNVLITTPLWVANTRLKLQGANFHTTQYKKEGKARIRYDGMMDCLLKIIHDEGIEKLWGGTVPSLLLATNPAIQFMVYEALKRYFKKTFNTADLSATMYFIIGAIAKAVATVITYPLQIIQSRLRAGYAKNESTQSLMENMLYMIRTKGFLALYKGLESKLIQTVLTAALMFLTYEKIASFIFKVMGMG